MPKRTAFYDIHKSLDAKIVDFAGYEMPVQYEGIIAEHMAVRNSVGVFDVSHMGEFFVKGKKIQAELGIDEIHVINPFEFNCSQLKTLVFKKANKK